MLKHLLLLYQIWNAPRAQSLLSERTKDKPYLAEAVS